MATIIHNPGGLGFRITEIYALVAVHGDDDEAVVGRTIGGTLMPLVMADKARLESMRPMFPELAKAFGKKLLLIKMTNREDLEVFEP